MKPGTLGVFFLPFIDLRVLHEEKPKRGLHKPKNGCITLLMDSPIYEYVLKNLEAHKGRWPVVARGSGVSKRTIEKIASRITKNPGVRQIEALAVYFKKEAA